HQYTVKFDLVKSWKGSQHPTMITYNLVSCGYSFVKGEKYLVFAAGYPPDYFEWATKPFDVAQDDITLLDSPQFQAKANADEELYKKLVNARDAISNMMGSKMSQIPISSVGVNDLNFTLDVGIADKKAALPSGSEEYKQKIEKIVGNVPIRVQYEEYTTALPDIITQHTALSSPLKQFKSGIDLFDIKCGNGLQRVVRYQDKLPLCVKFEHIQKMQARGMNLLLYAQESAPKELTVEGLHDSYKIGTKIDFTIKFKGTGYPCSFPVVFVTDSYSRIVWVSDMPVLLCDPDEKIGYKEVEWKTADLGDLKINDNSDSYRLIVMFNDKTLTKDFWIASQETHVTIPNGFSENKTSFEPKDIKVKVGINETVVWQNDDSVEHQIIADNYNDPGFYESTHFDPRNNSTIRYGQQFVHYFITPVFGTFGYHSESGQHGTVTVLPPDNQLIETQIQRPEPPPLEHIYSNDRIAIMKGAKVSWENIDNVTHTITSKNGVFDSGLIPPRTRFILDTTQLTPGYYDYFDKLNPTLIGGIRVVEPMINESYNKILIEKAKETKESQLFLKKYPDAMPYVENNYYDVVKLVVEKQVYPARMADSGTRSLELAIEFDPFHD
ncbi:MAG: hypothetical protein HY223_01945, partial [Thaumarchaeota archaeon]|nr:hypothetical protein [Nitrososphaerota archaeon]